jgi:hypothetical protein
MEKIEKEMRYNGTKQQVRRTFIKKLQLNGHDRIPFLAQYAQSEKLGLKDVFLGLYQYQIIKNVSSAG